MSSQDRKLTLTVDESDYDAIQAAISRRQSWRAMPDAEGGDAAGRVLAEICRGWSEMLDCHADPGPQQIE